VDTTRFSEPGVAFEATEYGTLTSPHPVGVAVPIETGLDSWTPPEFGLPPEGLKASETCAVESRHAPKIVIVPLEPTGNSLIGCGPLPESTNIELIVGGEQATGLNCWEFVRVNGGQLIE